MIFSRKFVIYGCNSDTRRWLLANGRNVPDNQPIPSDDFTRRQQSVVGTIKRERERVERAEAKSHAQ